MPPRVRRPRLPATALAVCLCVCTDALSPPPTNQVDQPGASAHVLPDSIEIGSGTHMHTFANHHRRAIRPCAFCTHAAGNHRLGNSTTPLHLRFRQIDLTVPTGLGITSAPHHRPEMGSSSLDFAHTIGPHRARTSLSGEVCRVPLSQRGCHHHHTLPLSSPSRRLTGEE